VHFSSTHSPENSLWPANSASPLRRPNSSTLAKTTDSNGTSSSALAPPLPRTSPPPPPIIFSAPIRLHCSRSSVTAADNAAINGFGAVLTKTNTIANLLLARKGSDLKIVTSGTPRLLRQIRLQSHRIGRRVFGCFCKNREGVTEGYGSLLIDSANSIPVTLKTSTLSGGTNTPPELRPLGDAISWKGLASTALKIELDAPTTLNLTTVRLLDKNKKVIASAEADVNGLAVLSLANAITGDYTVEVVRNYVDTALDPVKSDPFVITQRSAPAGSFQTNLSYGPFASNPKSAASPLDYEYDFTGSPENKRSATPDGNPYRARLTITTTAPGSFSGKVELVDLKTVYNENESDLDPTQPNETLFPATTATPTEDDPSATTPTSEDISTKVPVVLSIPIKGTLIADATDYQDGLIATVSLPTTKDGPVHSLRFIIYASDIGGTVDGTEQVASLHCPPQSH